MRHDMPERFADCPHKRSRSSEKFPRYRGRIRSNDDLEDAGVPKESMRGSYKASHKHGIAHHSDDWGPVRRFLRSHVGQPWDDVYSEICAEADSKSFLGYNLRHWLGYMVEQNCHIENGRVLDERGFDLSNRWTSKCFYVHPQTRKLEYIEGKRFEPPEPPKTVFEYNDKLYHKYNDVWYRVEMQILPWKKSPYGPYYHWETSGLGDACLGEDMANAFCMANYYWNQIRVLEHEYGKSPDGKPWFCKSKQTANHREIQKMKRANGID